MDHIKLIISFIVILNVSCMSSQSVSQTYISTACFFDGSGNKYDNVNMTMKCPESRDIQVERGRFLRPNSARDDNCGETCCSIETTLSSDDIYKKISICFQNYDTSTIGNDCNDKVTCTSAIPIIRIDRCKNTCPGTNTCYSRLVQVEYKCESRIPVTTTSATTATTAEETQAPTTTACTIGGSTQAAGGNITIMSEMLSSNGGETVVTALLVTLGIVIILLLGAGLAIAVLLRRLKLSKATEKTAHHLCQSSSVALPSDYHTAAATNNVPSKNTEFKNMACNEDDTEDENYESGDFQIDGNVMANQENDVNTGMEENLYYEGEQGDERRESMEENVYYEGSPQNNCDVKTVPNQKATEEVRRGESMEENVYYEGSPQNTTDNKPTPPDRKEGNYVYTYGHFQLEGRKRQTDTVL